MAARSPEQPSADDSAATADSDSLPAEGTGQRRYLLPSDVPAALTHLEANEFDALLAAVVDEAKRRGRPTLDPLAGLVAPVLSETEARQDRNAGLGGTKIAGSEGSRIPSLTIGQTNAVRAAFVAGIKPSTIARQFGLPQAAVKAALAAHGNSRKR